MEYIVRIMDELFDLVLSPTSTKIKTFKLTFEILESASGVTHSNEGR